jgi:hypothetical protein
MANYKRLSQNTTQQSYPPSFYPVSPIIQDPMSYYNYLNSNSFQPNNLQFKDQ